MHGSSEVPRLVPVSDDSTTAARWPMAALCNPKPKKSGVFWEPRPLAGSNFCADGLPFPKIWECAALRQRRQGLGGGAIRRNASLLRAISAISNEGGWRLKSLGNSGAGTAPAATFTKSARRPEKSGRNFNSYKKSGSSEFHGRQSRKSLRHSGK